MVTSYPPFILFGSPVFDLCILDNRAHEELCQQLEITCKQEGTDNNNQSRTGSVTVSKSVGKGGKGRGKGSARKGERGRNDVIDYERENNLNVLSLLADGTCERGRQKVEEVVREIRGGKMTNLRSRLIFEEDEERITPPKQPKVFCTACSLSLLFSLSSVSSIFVFSRPPPFPSLSMSNRSLLPLFFFSHFHDCAIPLSLISLFFCPSPPSLSSPLMVAS